MKLLAAALAAALAVTAVTAHAAPAAPSGQPNRAEAREKYFVRADVNKDGVLDRKELARVAAVKIRRMDTNKDGKITQAEFVAAGAKRAADKAAVADKRAARFAKLNPTGAEALEAKRLVAMRLNGLLRADANKDGVVSKDEFVTYTPKRAG